MAKAGVTVILEKMVRIHGEGKLKRDRHKMRGRGGRGCSRSQLTNEKPTH